MKKLSLILLSAVAVAQASAASFNGFYVGGQLGWTQRNNKVDADSTWGSVEREALKKGKKVNGLAYGLYTGYGQNNNGFYWGAELSVEHSTANKKVTFTLNDVVLAKYNYQRGVVFSISPRLGAVIANENLIYAKLAMETSRDTLKIEDETKHKSKTQFVLVPSVGYERAFGNLLARVEYGYNLGGKVKNDSATSKYTAHVVKFGLAYKF